MGKDHPSIDTRLQTWIEKQRLFFVATAPSGEEGLINNSPKGMDTFHVLGPHRVAWLDLTGSGAETIAHLRQNGRITIMFCAFEGPPRIVRLYGKGTFHQVNTNTYNELKHHFTDSPGARSIIEVEVSRIRDSCGYSVPLYDYQGDREILSKWAQKKGTEGIQDYQDKNNRVSLDGLPALPDTKPS